MRRVLALLFLTWVSCTPCPAALPNATSAASLADARALSQQGEVRRAIELLQSAARQATVPLDKATIAGELGMAQIQARDLPGAAISLAQAYSYFQGTERARISLHLGKLAVLRRQPKEAADHYREALALAPGDQEIAHSAALNLAALGPAEERLAHLHKLSGSIEAAHHHLNLGHQAAQLNRPGLQLAHTHIVRARAMATQAGNRRLRLEASDSLASLYETEGRSAESLALTMDALEQAARTEPALVADLLIALEWRQARLRQQLGQPDAALAAYLRAVERLRASRDDIPIDYDNGRSSLRETIAPLYLGYAGAMLQRSESQAPADAQATLRQVRDAVEQVKQAELQDYLGDRCVVETVQGGSPAALAPGVAIMYPIIFPDRLELLMQTSAGISRHTTRVDSTALSENAEALAFALRNGVNDFLPASRQLYDWLLGPFDRQLEQQSITTLVLVPDGALRLLPAAALHDGKRYAIEKYAISTVTGMTMTNAAPPRKRKLEALVVGVSDPGPVVARLQGTLAGALLQGSSTRSIGGVGQGRAVRAMRGAGGSDEQWRPSLQWPGVKQELDALAKVLPGRQMLNAQFTLGQFRREAEDSGYRIIHIASHGVFGGNADSSFIMAYDDLLTMDGLQSILKSDRYTRSPLELLSLSACETAEGNERAPLGMSGAAMKARAKSVLGTLWPLEDNAAQQIMTRFYSGLATGGLGKAEALRQAQLSLVRDPATAHPFFWGPFVLIGNWQ